MKYKAPRGTRDFLPEATSGFQHLQRVAQDLFERYGYKLIITPTFEQTELFIRGIGEATDIVQKEMYTFKDRRGRSLTLRPEGTAPVVRAYLEHNLGKFDQLVKLYYSCAMYRYERPQAGRYREFWQIGVEALGSLDPTLDAEIIYLSHDYLKRVGVGRLDILLNSMGCRKCRPAFTAHLKNYLALETEKFCSDCQRRLKINPLRVFDCQNESCQIILEKAPVVTDYLCGDCEQHFKAVRKHLKTINLKFMFSPKLVRGFDYYTKTTFEIQSPHLGAQNALGGGGRYDYLVEEYGGPPTPAIGFALGVERIIMALKNEGSVPAGNLRPLLFLILLGDEAKGVGIKLLFSLRDAGIAVETTYDQKSLKAQLRTADKLKASYAGIIGSQELKENFLTLKDMRSGEQLKMPFKEAPQWLKERANDEKIY